VHPVGDRQPWMVRSKPEPLIERRDIDAVLAALFDIRHELSQIRTILKEEDGEAGEDS
jgi:hypothetical protein